MKLLKQRLFFLTQSLLKPRQTGAISPSSSYLASAMAQEIYLKSDANSIMELGGGTGSLTKGLLAYGINPEKLIIVEKNPLMVRELRKKFPTCHIKEADAQNLTSLVIQQDSDKTSLRTNPSHQNGFNSFIDSIISGLPLRSLPQTISEKILIAAFSLLPPQGRFIQFTYGLRSPVPEALLTTHRMRVLKKNLILKNFPPATIWVYEKLPP